MKVKYLYYSFKKANELSLLDSYIFWLQLKSLGLKQSEIHRGDFLNEISSQLNISKAKVSLKIKELIKDGFISVYRHSNGNEWKYIVHSYKTVFNKLGFRFKDNYINRYRFEYINIEGLTKAEVKALVFALELNRNKLNQNFRIKQKCDRKIEYHSATLDKVKSKKVIERKKKALKQLSDFKLSLNDGFLTNSLEGKGGRLERPIENQISCKRASLLLGYKSSMMGVKLHQKAKEKKFLSVKRSKKLIARGVSKEEFLNSDKFQSNTYWIYGSVYTNYANKYILFPNNKQNQSLFKTRANAPSLLKAL